MKNRKDGLAPFLVRDLRAIRGKILRRKRVAGSAADPPEFFLLRALRDLRAKHGTFRTLEKKIARSGAAAYKRAAIVTKGSP
jgi:hypothetical protein